MPAKTNLPTNPSARDRRALQSTVAARIARSKQSNHRRRTSDDDSLSSSTSTLSSKGSTPIKIGSQTPQRFIYSNSSNAANSRKRKENTISQKYRYQHNNKKQRLHNKHVRTIDPDEAETIEKRNLHNNMERQRRIGLKNLFEELKRQIPTLKEKERAPKVNILREAAAYCTKLRRDDELHNELTKKNQRLMTKLRNLKASVAAQQQRRNY
jgi:Myc proto-oncogene protein